MKKTLACLLAFLLTVALMQSALAGPTVFHASIKSKAPFATVQTVPQNPFGAQDDLLRVDFINIKIGDAILVRAGGQSLMIDGGTNDKLPRVEEFLKSQNLSGFTYYFSSHWHDDHLKAAIRLVKKGYTAQAFLGKYPLDTKIPEMRQLYAELDASGVPYRQVVTGESLNLGGALITFFYDERDTPDLGVNGKSMMAHIRFGERSLLLTADVSGAGLTDLAADFPHLMDVDVMKSPHHGLNRLAPEFFAATSPEVVVLTTNMNNGRNLARQLVNLAIPHYYISMGTVSLYTDGQTWFVEQASP